MILPKLTNLLVRPAYNLDIWAEKLTRKNTIPYRPGLIKNDLHDIFEEAGGLDYLRLFTEILDVYANFSKDNQLCLIRFLYRGPDGYLRNCFIRLMGSEALVDLTNTRLNPSYNYVDIRVMGLFSTDYKKKSFVYSGPNDVDDLLAGLESCLDLAFRF